MVKGRVAIAVLGAAVLAVSVAGCGSSHSSSDKAAGPGDFKGKTLTVWVMSGSNPPGWTKDITAAFEKKYTGAKLNIKVQTWDGIQQKLTTALSESTPP